MPVRIPTIFQFPINFFTVIELTGSFLRDLDKAAVVFLVWVDRPERPHDLSVEDLLLGLEGRDGALGEDLDALGRHLAALLAVEDGVLHLHAHLQLVALALHVAEVEEDLLLTCQGLHKSEPVRKIQSITNLLRQE